jgi:hypothetical protein
MQVSFLFLTASRSCTRRRPCRLCIVIHGVGDYGMCRVGDPYLCGNWDCYVKAKKTLATVCVILKSNYQNIRILLIRGNFCSGWKFLKDSASFKWGGFCAIKVCSELLPQKIAQVTPQSILYAPFSNLLIESSGAATVIQLYIYHTNLTPEVMTIVPHHEICTDSLFKKEKLHYVTSKLI